MSTSGWLFRILHFDILERMKAIAIAILLFVGLLILNAFFS